MENKDVRLINANALLETICKKCPEYDCEPDATDTVSGCLIYDVIASAPTIDAQPVKHGRWIDTIVRGCHSIYCSECGTNNETICPSDFCPNCGSYNGGK